MQGTWVQSPVRGLTTPSPPRHAAGQPNLSLTPQSESPCAATKTWHSQINNRLLILGEKEKFCLQRLSVMVVRLILKQQQT